MKIRRDKKIIRLDSDLAAALKAVAAIHVLHDYQLLELIVAEFLWTFHPDIIAKVKGNVKKEGRQATCHHN